MSTDPAAASGTSCPAPDRLPRTIPLLLGLTRFAQRLPALVPVVVFLAVVWADFGAGLNIPALFWHEPFNGADEATWGFGLMNGLSVGLLFAYLWIVTYVLDTKYNPDATARVRESRLAAVIAWAYPYKAQPPDPDAVRFRYYMAVTFVPCAALLALACVISVAGREPWVHFRAPDPSGQYTVSHFSNRWPVLAGLGLALVVLRVLQSAGAGAYRALTPEPLARRWVHATLGGVYLCQLIAYFVLTVLANEHVWYPPPVVAACVLFGLIAGACAFVWYHAGRWALPAFGAVGLWLGCANSDEKIGFPELRGAPPVNLLDEEEPDEHLSAAPEARAAQWRATAETVRKRVARLAPGAARAELEAALANRASQPVSPGTYAGLYELHRRALDGVADEERALLCAWQRAAPVAPGKPLPKLVIVTVTGGANRSALWTTKVLHELHTDKQLPGFTPSVRVITGASGGMVGAAYFVGSLADAPPHELQPGFRPTDVAQQHIFPIASSLVFREVPCYFAPGRYTWDRGEALDLSLQGRGGHIAPDVRARLGAAFGAPDAGGRALRDLDAGERAGWRPALLFTPMMIEDGRRLVLSNRPVPYLTTSAGTALASGSDTPGGTGGAPKPRATRDVYSHSGIEFFQLFPPDGAPGATFRLSTAARMNATFPFVSPAAALPTTPARRVVDAGYYDNYGVGTAAAWLHQWRDWLWDHTSGVLVVQIRDHNSQYDRRHLVRQSELVRDSNPLQLKGRRGSALEWVTGPLEAVDRARQATASYRNDELLATIDAYFTERAVASVPQGLVQRIAYALVQNRSAPTKFFQTVVFERYSNVGMSWYLNSDDMGQILNSWDRSENGAALERMREWWNQR